MIERFFYDILTEQAVRAPNHEAIIMGDTRLTYRELVDKIDAVAALLLNKGLHKNDKVVLWSMASPAWLYVYYGIIRAGGVAVVLNANLTLKDATPLVEYADAVFLMYGRTHDCTGAPSDVQKIADTFGLDADKCMSIASEHFADVAPTAPETTGWSVHDDAYIIYTSGTTGFPKAVLTSQYALVNLVSRLAKATDSIRGKRALLGVPLFHAYAITVAWVYLSNGGTIIIPEALKADVIANLVAKEETSDLWSVATIYQGIIDDEGLVAMVAPRARLCTLAGSYTSPVQFMRFETSLYNATFLNLYGMTETSSAYTITRPDDDISVRYNTVGRAVEGIEACAWDKDRGILPPGEVGEVITRGYHLMNGYYKLAADKQAIDEDGWLHSGDLGVFDEQGNLRIVGRIKDLIIKGGENLAPAEIEAQVMTHPSIATCRIFGYKDRIYGENLGACITLAPGATFDEADIRKFVKGKVGSYKSPVHYFVFDKFPLNANGKVDQVNLHIDMLRRLHRLVLEHKLDEGIQIIALSLKNSTYNITPVAALVEETAMNLGFSERKARIARRAVEEALIMRINETSDDVGDIEVSIRCLQDHLTISITDNDMENDPIRNPDLKFSIAILTKLVDDYVMRRLDNGKYQIEISFTYDEEFVIEDFLMQHVAIELSRRP